MFSDRAAFLRPVALIAMAMALGACADVSRIEPEDARQPAMTPISTGAGPSGPYPVGTHTTGHSRQFDTLNTPLDGAVRSQVWRLDQRERDIAIIPHTDPVPRDQIDTLRQQRMHAETLARSGHVPRPVLGAGSSSPEFVYPSSPGTSRLNQSITRARATEASALTR